jgi:hypothetical protein
MTWLFPALFALGAGGITFLLARFGFRAGARAAVLALVLLILWQLWDWTGADEGMEDLALLVTILLLLLPALIGAAIGLWLGERARRRRG